MARPSQLTLCSFCGKSHSEVRKLIQGPGVYICDNCIVVCKNVLDKELRAESRKQLPKLSVPRPGEIKRQLDLHCIGQEHAKKTLAVAVHNHYKRIQATQAGVDEADHGWFIGFVKSDDGRPLSAVAVFLQNAGPGGSGEAARIGGRVMRAAIGESRGGGD